MDDDFTKALNKFNARLSLNRQRRSKELENFARIKSEREKKRKNLTINKLKQDLELHYTDNSDNRIYQKKLILPLNKKCSRLQEHSDKILLPVSILKILETHCYDEEIQHPYTFRIQNLENNYITHACVLEFSAEEGMLFVSENVKENLGIKETSGIKRLLVTYTNLPKCNFIKFETSQDNLKNIPYMKNLLEGYLSSNYSTLTLGDYVYVNNTLLYIKELEPDNAVSLINADVNVDLCVYNDETTADEEPNNYNKDIYERISLNSNVHGITSDKLNKFTFVMDQKTVHLLKEDKISIDIECNTREHSNALIVVISFSPLNYVSENFHHLYVSSSSVVHITKDIILQCLKTHFVCFSKEEKPLWDYLYDFYFPQMMYIGIGSINQSHLEFDLVLRMKEIIHKSEIQTDNKYFGYATNHYNPKNFEKRQDNKSTNMELCKNTFENNNNNNNNYAKCENCLKSILKINIDMHKMHCLKNICLCTICKKPIKRNEINEHTHCSICNEVINPENKEVHNLLWHTKIKCICGNSFFRKEFILHQKLFCNKRIIYCPYCNIFIEARDEVNEENFIASEFFKQMEKQSNKENTKNPVIVIEDIKTKSNPSMNSFDYYYNLLNSNLNYFLQYIRGTEHENYCGTKSVDCVLCKNYFYRNKYWDHLHVDHKMDRIKSYKILCENLDISSILNES